MQTPLQRLYKTKLGLMALIATAFGSALLIAAHWVATQSIFPPLRGFPVSDFGAVFLTSGVVVIGFTYADHEDEETRESERLNRILLSNVSAFRDSVIDGFAFAPEALTTVASPATLDRIIENSLAIRLGDAPFAHDVYADVRAQAIRAPERAYDTDISVALAPWSGGPEYGSGSMFVATVTWEYRVVPAHPTMRFACVSDLEEYADLLQDPTNTALWYFQPIAGLDASSREVFELVRFAVDGKMQTVRRSTRNRTQIFTANLDAEVMAAKEEVAISYTYRTLVQKNSHLLHLDIAQPTKGFKAQFWYGDCGIQHVNVYESITGAKQARIVQTPASEPTPSVTIASDGWVWPKAGVAFVWVLKEEVAAGKQGAKGTSGSAFQKPTT